MELRLKSKIQDTLFKDATMKKIHLCLTVCVVFKAYIQLAEALAPVNLPYASGGRAKHISLRPLWSSSGSQQDTAQTTTKSSTGLGDDQKDFVLGYLNKHHGSVLKKFAEAFTPVGSEMASANVWSGGSYEILSATITDIDAGQVGLEVSIQRRGKPNETRSVSFPMDADPVGERARYFATHPAVPKNIDGALLPIDDIARKICRLCWIVKEPAVTGKMILLAIQLGGAGIGKLPDSMYLNQVPHNRYVRQYFYEKAATAVHDAVVLCAKKNKNNDDNTLQISNRMKVTSQFPEMNPSMDSYRIGTILEMARAITIRLAEENLRVRLCVQQSMGVGIFTAVPKQLNGVSRLIQAMDWESDEGEENEGMVGDFVRFGGVGPDHVLNQEVDEERNIVQHQDDAFVIIAPQSMVGTDTSIIPLLEGMVKAAGDRPVILINPDLTDKVSAAGQQNIRGRKERIEFAESFDTVYHFQNIYVSGTSYFPILGAITKLHPTEQWVAHQRRDLSDDNGEVYLPVLAGECTPDGADILEAFET